MFILTCGNVPHKYDMWQLVAVPRASIYGIGAEKEKFDWFHF